MTRGIGAFDAIESVLPDAVALLAALATQLGDVWFVGVLLVGLHWYADDEIVDRNAVMTVAGLTIGALGLAFALKYAFTLPRPPTRLARPDQFPGLVEPLYVATGTASSYGFPSGHAVTSTVVYGLLAQRLSVRTRRWRYGVAAAIVTLVCATRVVLGVHYLVDVVAGAALGAAYVAGTWYALSQVDDAA
ncbi:phosphatase PAP2 family protein, partial [Natronoarchaeum mannanilyticum]